MTEENNQEESVKEEQESVEQETVDQENTEAQDKVDNEESTSSDEDKIAELNDKYLRLYSEFENFRRRTAKEKLDLVKTAGSGVITKLLPILDDFERAIKSNEESDDIDAIKEGITLIHNKLQHCLILEGLKEMETENCTFDAELHEAITQIPAPSEDLKGKVVDTVEKGYYLNEKVIRYAKVVVGN